MPWPARFDEPIAIARKRPLRTLAEARDYILALPPAEQTSIAWRTALGLLEQAARHGEPYIAMARLAVSRALKKAARGVASVS